MNLYFNKTVLLTKALLQNKRILADKHRFFRHWSHYHPNIRARGLYEIKPKEKSIHIYATQYRPIINPLTNIIQYYIRIGYIIIDNDKANNPDRKYFWWIDNCGAYLGEVEFLIEEIIINNIF